MLQSVMNRERALLAIDAVDSHALVAGNDDDIETNICDLLCNLMHAADHRDVSFDRCLTRGREHYEIESAENHVRPEVQLAEALEVLRTIRTQTTDLAVRQLAIEALAKADDRRPIRE